LAASIAKSNNKKAKIRRRKRQPNFKRKSVDQNFLEIDKATIAANIQLQEQKRDLIYNCIALGMKIGLLAIFAGSFVRLGIASHQRIMRHIEISSVLNLELKRLDDLNRRFDQLFTIGGKERLIGEQDHLIAPNSFRVIWK
tara:strand:- start:333 stop:755 length:423 start_codon:yes stop_codon:yes gene_type:complete